MHPMVSTGKRYVGAIAKSGGFPYGKRDDNAQDEDLLRELLKDVEEKRSLASLARGGSLQGKRSVEALARAGYLPVLKPPQESEEYPHESGEASEEVKRNLGSLARNGYLKRDNDELDDLLEDLYEKRNVASLIKNGYSPFAPQGKRYLGSIMRNQRNIGAMARNWHFPEHLKFGKRQDDDDAAEEEDEEEELEDVTKRYVAALLRHGSLPVGGSAGAEMNEDKRHIGSLAAKGSFQVHKKSVRSAGRDEPAYNSTTKNEENKRSKRQATYLANSDEFPMPVLQNTDLFDYEDLTDILNGDAAPEKRFLGSVARSGWFRDNGNRMLHTSTMTKRHIGSLARLGWLPAFRSSRYSRSGRASPAPPDDDEEHS
ncbi:hypothetical protein L9F63_008515, partial [Diploptera punctata]